MALFVFCCACSVFWESLTVVCQRRIAVTFPSETRHDATHVGYLCHSSHLFTIFPQNHTHHGLSLLFTIFPPNFSPNGSVSSLLEHFTETELSANQGPHNSNPTRLSQLHSGTRGSLGLTTFLSQLGWRKKTGPRLKSKTFIGVVCPTRVFDEEKGPWPLSRTNNLYVFYICVFDEEKGVGHC